MTKFKTTDDLQEHYWSVIVPMTRKYNESLGVRSDIRPVKPWECVKHVNEGVFEDHPEFKGKPWNYTLALTILEGKPVFVGDILYYKETNKFRVSDSEEKQSFEDCTWTPPTKKRTFMLNGVELSEEDMDKLISLTSVIATYQGHDMKITCRKLTEARDKE